MTWYFKNEHVIIRGHYLIDIGIGKRFLRKFNCELSPYVQKKISLLGHSTKLREHKVSLISACQLVPHSEVPSTCSFRPKQQLSL